MDINENVTLVHVKQHLKDCFRNHKKSFNLAKHKNDSEISKEFWEIKMRNGTPKIAWEIIRVCLLCSNEKYKIVAYK